MGTSKSFDWRGTGKKFVSGAFIALAGALATYLQDTIPGIEFGSYQVLAVAINSMLVNGIRNYVRSF